MARCRRGKPGPCESEAGQRARRARSTRRARPGAAGRAGEERALWARNTSTPADPEECSMAGQTADAVVIGAGPNGLVAANALADAGWDVVVLEANEEVGGAVRSAEVTAPGFVNDMFSAFYPLAAASPVIRGLDLGAARPACGRRPRASSRMSRRGPGRGPRPRRRAYGGGAGRVAPGDGERWLAMVEQWHRVRDPCWTRCSRRSRRCAPRCGCCVGWAPPDRRPGPAGRDAGAPARPASGSRCGRAPCC